jgi:UDP-N-acetylglucosamine 4,6-dehydratase
VKKESFLFDEKTLLITGGTGSFGQFIVPKLLNRYAFKKVIIFSRDEMKQWEMSKRIAAPNLRYFIGDVRDKDRLYRALDGVDYVIHAAATKIVPTAEYNPFECVKTNVMGAMNVIDACIDRNVSKVIALSTDKASAPLNLYGATKLTSDKLFVAANSYSKPGSCQFGVVRYGNVMCSRGSVIPLFQEQAECGILRITDLDMTRFMISLDQATNFVLSALEQMIGGEIFVKKIPSMKVIDIAKAVSQDAQIEVTGIRPGEKLHEQMISREEARLTIEFPGHYVVLPSTFDSDSVEHWAQRFEFCAKVPDDFSYASNSNSEWWSSLDLMDWLSKNNPKY